MLLHPQVQHPTWGRFRDLRTGHGKASKHSRDVPDKDPEGSCAVLNRIVANKKLFPPIILSQIIIGGELHWSYGYSRHTASASALRGSLTWFSYLGPFASLRLWDGTSSNHRFSLALSIGYQGKLVHTRLHNKVQLSMNEELSWLSKIVAFRKFRSLSSWGSSQVVNVKAGW